MNNTFHFGSGNIYFMWGLKEIFFFIVAVLLLGCYIYFNNVYVFYKQAVRTKLASFRILKNDSQIQNRSINPFCQNDSEMTTLKDTCKGTGPHTGPHTLVVHKRGDGSIYVEDVYEDMIEPSSCNENQFQSQNSDRGTSEDEKITTLNKKKKMKSKKVLDQSISSNKAEAVHVNVIVMPQTPSLVNRCGTLANNKYIKGTTYKIQQTTVFRRKFFHYWKIQFIEYVPDLNKIQSFKEPRIEMILAGILHTLSWPVPFPFMKYQDLKVYKPMIEEKQSHLDRIEKAVQKLNLPNITFFNIRIYSFQAFYLIGEGKLGKAMDVINGGMCLANNLEPCEWTAWIYLSHAFLYITWGGQSRKDVSFRKALPYLDTAMKHFQADIEKGGSFNIGTSLILWWTFLIKSKRINSSNGSASQSKDSPPSPYNWNLSGISKMEVLDCLSILQQFEKEISQIQNFPPCKGKIKHIIESFRTAAKERIVSEVTSKRKKLARSLGKVPSYIQSMYTNRHTHKIVINIDIGNKDNAKKFIATKNREMVKSGLITFVEQKSRPKYAGKSKYAANPVVDNRTKCLLAPGAKIVSFDEQKYQNLIKKEECTSFLELAQTFDLEISYGSLGGLLYDEPTNVIYGTTAEHTLADIDSNNESAAFGCHVNVTEKAILLELLTRNSNGLLEIDEITVLNTKYTGILDTIKEQNCPVAKGIDIGIFEVDKTMLDSPYCKMFLENESGKKITHKVFTGESTALLKRNVQKYGARTNYTEGEIIDVDAEFNVANEMCEGTFLVANVLGSPFAEKGDSGSWVVDKHSVETEAFLYGTVHKVQEDYYDDSTDMGYEHVTWCLRMDNSLQALNTNEECQINLDVCNYNDFQKYLTKSSEAFSSTSGKTESKDSVEGNSDLAEASNVLSDISLIEKDTDNSHQPDNHSLSNTDTDNLTKLDHDSGYSTFPQCDSTDDQNNTYLLNIQHSELRSSELNEQ